MTKCILHLKDQVNCKIEGLSAGHRKQLVDKFKFEIPGARHMPAVRLGRWDGTKSYFALGGSTYVNLLPQIIPMLIDWGYDPDLVDYRPPEQTFEFDVIDEDTFADKVWPKGHPAEGQPIVLREDQIEATNRFLADTQSISELATGFGKTLVTAALSYSCEKYGRTIVIVPNKTLVNQTYADYVNLGLDVGVFFGDRKEFGKTHTICTWQSLNILMKSSRNSDLGITINDFLEDVICVIVDECHMTKADVLTAILTGCMAHIPIRWGFTGTVPEDELSQHALLISLGPVINQIAAYTLQEQGVLSNCHVTIKQLVDHVEYKEYQDELRYLLEDADRLEQLSSMIETIRQTGNTLVLIDRVEPGKVLASKIKDAVFVSGGTKTNDRKDEYDAIAAGDNKVLVCTYGVAAVGINIVRIRNVVLVEPGKSFVRVIQSIGRGLRKGFEKDFVDIFDITSDCKYAKRHLTTRKRYYTKAQYPFKVEKVIWKV